MQEYDARCRALTRRTLFAGAAAGAIALGAEPAAAQRCPSPPHVKGPVVWLDMDQQELDDAYDQSVYAFNQGNIAERRRANSEAVLASLGTPQRVAYGPTEIEKLDIYRTRAANAPVFVFIHGGTWQFGSAKDYAFPAETFVHAGAHFVVLDFASVNDTGGDLAPLAEQVRRGIGWVYKNAASFGGDPERIYIGGHSSGGHLCGVALITDWGNDFGLPATIVKGGLCMSGMYEMMPVRLSWRRTYIKFTDAMADAMSSQRHIDKLAAPIVVTYGSFETPDFQRQSRDFAAAVKAAGKPVELIEAANYAHLEMCESLGNPYGPNGRAALALMKLAAG